MSVQGRILVLGHLGEAQYRLGDWDAAAANGALAVSLVRDAGVLLGAGPTSALAAHVAAGRGAWDAAEERVATAALAAELLPWWGARAHAATARAVLAQARGDHAAMLDALAVYDDPAVHGPVDGVGVLPWRALRVEALLGVGRIDEAKAALAELEERVARRPPGWSALDAARLRCEIAEIASGSRRGAPGVRRGDGARASRCPPSWPAPAWRSAHGRYLLAVGERRPAVDLLRTAHARLGTARRRAVPRPVRRAAARRRAAPPAAGGTLDAHPAGARRRPPGRRGPDQPGGRRGAVRHGPDRRVPPQQHLRQARRLLPPRAGRAAQQRNWQVRWKVLTVRPRGRGTLGRAPEPRAWRGRCDC